MHLVDGAFDLSRYILWRLVLCVILRGIRSQLFAEQNNATWVDRIDIGIGHRDE